MSDKPEYKVGEIVLSKEQIKERVAELGRKISEDYAGEPIFAVGILKGAFVFMADLIREIDADLELDFMIVSSYGNSTESSGTVKIEKDLDSSPSGKNILIVEDIIDTGNTLKYLKEHYFANKNAKSVKIVTLLSKPSRRTADIEPDYIGFEIEDKFIIGCGLDYAEKYRQLSDIKHLIEDK
ncbi:MAG: hypoxanthine phosphoribosyltransferase [Anaerovoracaceae bacterium]